MSDGHATHGDCPSELTLSIYVDREQEADERRHTETHLVGCRTCRELVLALEEEATAFQRALRADEAPAPVLQPAASPTHIATGFGSATIAAAAAVAVFGWVAKTTPWLVAYDWLNPLRWGRAFGLLFDAIAMFRSDAPALYQFAVSTAALATVAFLLTASFTLITRRSRQTASFALTALVLGASIAAAPEASAVEFFFEGEERTLPAGETVEHSWISGARTITIDGTLRGDLVALGDRVVVNGVVEGNVVGLARKVEVRGRVEGSLFAVGERVRIAGTVEGNTYTAAGRTTLTETGSLSRDLAFVGDGVLIAGTVGRDATTISEWVEVQGRVGRNLTAGADKAEVTRGAAIGGDLHLMWHNDEQDIVVDPGATIGGASKVEEFPEELDHEPNRYTTLRFYVIFALTLAGAFATGMLLFRGLPWIYSGGIGSGGELLRTLAIGFAVLLAVPFGCIVVGLTVIGVPIGVIGLLAFLVCAYLAKIVLGGVIGIGALGEPIDEADWQAFAAPLAAGLAIVWIASSLPFVGGVVSFLMRLVGLGLIADRVRVRLGM